MLKNPHDTNDYYMNEKIDFNPKTDILSIGASSAILFDPKS